MTGRVSLVGAGPGDPELLTRRAVRRLREADLVLYDALVSREALAFARGARCFSVGKRAGQKGIAQETIHRLMIRSARRGQKVVRLKCGDPFVFGRGGEEMLALRAAGVPVEVVPGVSSALAAPALAGIPVTHRGVASAFLVVSGHNREAYAGIVEALPPGSVTLIVLMGVRTRAVLATDLLRAGWAHETPAALILGASTADETVWRGTLGELPAADPPQASLDPPGLVVIGDVVALAEPAGAVEVAAPRAAGRKR